jgi:hypothetical protein
MPHLNVPITAQVTQGSCPHVHHCKCVTGGQPVGPNVNEYKGHTLAGGSIPRCHEDLRGMPEFADAVEGGNAQQQS